MIGLTFWEGFAVTFLFLFTFIGLLCVLTLATSKKERLDFLKDYKEFKQKVHYKFRNLERRAAFRKFKNEAKQEQN